MAISAGIQKASQTRASLHSDARAFRRPRYALLNFGWLSVCAAFLLCLLGVAAIDTVAPAEARRQIAFLCLGIGAAAVVCIPDYRLVRRLNTPLLLVVLALLVFVLVPSVPESLVRPRNGSRRWITLPGFDFQPSELAKIVYVTSVAAYLQTRRNFRRFFGLLVPLALSFIPMGLILREPDLGTALLFLPTLFAMLVAAGAKLRHLVVIVTIGVACAPLLFFALQDHQQQRIVALWYQLQNDTRHADGIGYQGGKAIMLTGAGGVTGVGGHHARDLVEHNVLPESHNDMVFAVITLRWGALGAVGVWVLFLTLCVGGLIVAARTHDPFGRLIVVGIVCAIFAQMTINTGMTIGVLPITGMNLPFVSYGGSSLITTWLMIGLLMSVALRRPQYLAREAREFDQYHEAA